MGDVLVAVHGLIANSGLLEFALEHVTKYLGLLRDSLKSAFYTLVGFLVGLADGSSTFRDVLRLLGGLIPGIGDFALSFTGALGNMQEFTTFVSNKLLPVLDWIGDRLGNIGLKEIGIIAVGVGLIAISKTLLKAFNPIGNLFNGFASVLTATSSAIKSFTLSTKAQALFTIAKAITLLAGSLVVLSFIPDDKLAIGLGALTAMMVELVVAMLLLNKIQNPAKIGIQLTALSSGLFIVAKAAANFADMSWEGLGKAGLAIGGVLALMVGFSKAMNVIDSLNFAATSSGMIKFAVGLMALAGSLAVLASLSSGSLIQGVGALAALLAILAIYSKFINGFDFAVASTGMVKFAIGIVALTGALAFLGNLSFGTLLQGSVALLALLTILALYVKMVNGKDWTKANTGLVGLGIGLLAL